MNNQNTRKLFGYKRKNEKDMRPYYYLYRVIAGVEMLQYLCHDLPLRTGVFLPHGSVHQFRYILVEVRDEML
jgi:hypothetical protein